MENRDLKNDGGLFLVPKPLLGNIIVKEAPASWCSSYRRLRLNSGSWNFQNNNVPKLEFGNEVKI